MAASAGANTIMIDDFTSSTLNSNWKPSIVLNYGGTTQGTYTYDTTTNAGNLTATMSGFSGVALQGVLLRSDYSLGVGDTVSADLTHNSATTNSNNNYGLVITAQTGISAQKDMMFINYWPSPSYTYFEVHWTNDAGNDSYLISGKVAAANVAGMYISRTGQTTYTVGYSTNTTSPTTPVPLKSYDTTGNLTLGGAMGVYADLRSNTSVAYDNFRMRSHTEPSNLALLAAGLAGLLAYAWRKRR